MRESERKTKEWIWGLIGTAFLVICALMIALLFWPHVTKPRVAFVGFTKSASGTSQAVFTIHNSGRGTLRRWDFYEYSLQDGRPPTEIHLGPDALLALGESETVNVDIPSDSVQWKLTFHFSDYAPAETFAYTTDIPVAEGLAGSSVDRQMTTDWITAPEQYRRSDGRK